MSTIYTFHSECSTMDTLASGDEFLVYDASTGRTVSATSANIATYVGTSPTITGATITGLTVAGAAVYSANASFSFLIGTTLSSRIGFYGIAGTSQPASANQASVTYTAAAVSSVCASMTTFGFSTSTIIDGLVNLILAIRSALVDNGLIKGAS